MIWKIANLWGIFGRLGSAAGLGAALGVLSCPLKLMVVPGSFGEVKQPLDLDSDFEPGSHLDGEHAGDLRIIVG